MSCMCQLFYATQRKDAHFNWQVKLLFIGRLMMCLSQMLYESATEPWCARNSMVKDEIISEKS